MNKAQTSLREKVAITLGWVRKNETGFIGADPTRFYWSGNGEDWYPEPNHTHFIPDPEDVAVVWRLRELAIERDRSAYLAALKDVADLSGRWTMAISICADLPTMRTASLSVLHGVSVEEVRSWV